MVRCGAATRPTARWPKADPGLSLRLARLPATCRTALVVLASANAASDLLAASFTHLGIDGRALDPAEDAGIVTTNGPVVQFCDPLVGSVVLAVASPQQRRAAHAALAVAASDDPERHVDHMAAAAFGPSEEVAAALSIAATEAQRRGGANAAAVALEKAALFTPAGSERFSIAWSAWRRHSSWQVSPVPRSVT